MDTEASRGLTREHQLLTVGQRHSSALVIDAFGGFLLSKDREPTCLIGGGFGTRFPYPWVCGLVNFRGRRTTFGKARIAASARRPNKLVLR